MTEPLSVDQEYTARELLALGVDPAKAAALMQVDQALIDGLGPADDAAVVIPEPVRYGGVVEDEPQPTRWAPAATPESTYVDVLICAPGTLSGFAKERGRLVKLWGQMVAINEQDRVHCDGCCYWHDVSELSVAGHGHRVGLRSSLVGLVPSKADDES